ncbi:hypothetical protein QE152_g7887 [Popillia japonica]|uniref:Retroviral polymerase SH3-like domain-containing protein n=1 Tax=Popillia japonica TaxID=7064 RepID=A0AAW1MCN8_POPJA
MDRQETKCFVFSGIWMWLSEERKIIIEPRGKPAIFLGYSESSKGYRWLSEERKIIISRDVKFATGETGVPTTFEDFIPEDWYQVEESSSKNRTMEVELAPLEVPEQHEDIVEDQVEDRHQPRRGRGRPRIIRTGMRERPRLEYQPVQEERQRRRSTSTRRARS